MNAPGYLTRSTQDAPDVCPSCKQPCGFDVEERTPTQNNPIWGTTVVTDCCGVLMEVRELQWDIP